MTGSTTPRGSTPSFMKPTKSAAVRTEQHLQEVEVKKKAPKGRSEWIDAQSPLAKNAHAHLRVSGVADAIPDTPERTYKLFDQWGTGRSGVDMSKRAKVGRFDEPTTQGFMKKEREPASDQLGPEHADWSKGAKVKGAVAFGKEHGDRFESAGSMFYDKDKVIVHSVGLAHSEALDSLKTKTGGVKMGGTHKGRFDTPDAIQWVSTDTAVNPNVGLGHTEIKRTEGVVSWASQGHSSASSLRDSWMGPASKELGDRGKEDSGRSQSPRLRENARFTQSTASSRAHSPGRSRRGPLKGLADKKKEKARKSPAGPSPLSASATPGSGGKAATTPLSEATPGSSMASPEPVVEDDLEVGDLEDEPEVLSEAESPVAARSPGIAAQFHDAEGEEEAAAGAERAGAASTARAEGGGEDEEDFAEDPMLEEEMLAKITGLPAAGGAAGAEALVGSRPLDDSSVYASDDEDSALLDNSAIGGPALNPFKMAAGAVATRVGEAKQELHSVMVSEMKKSEARRKSITALENSGSFSQETLAAAKGNRSAQHEAVEAAQQMAAKRRDSEKIDKLRLEAMQRSRAASASSAGGSTEPAPAQPSTSAASGGGGDMAAAGPSGSKSKKGERKASDVGKDKENGIGRTIEDVPLRKMPGPAAKAQEAPKPKTMFRQMKSSFTKMTGLSLKKK